MKKPVVLRIYKNSGNGDELLGVKQFAQAQIVIGRQDDAQVPLEGDSVSIIHASIEERGDGYVVMDLGSESGTFKNGERVLDTPIDSGDSIKVGEYTIEFFIGAPRPKAVETPKMAAPTPPAVPPMAPIPPPPSPVIPKAPISSAPRPNDDSNRPKPKAVPLSPPSIPQGPTNRIEAGSTNPGMGSATGAFSNPVGGTPRMPPPTNKHGKKKGTFAKPSRNKDVSEIVKPGKGTVIEVLVAWRERVISTHHFNEAKTVTMGSHPSNDIVLPLFASPALKVPIVKIERQALVLISGDQQGRLVRGSDVSSFAQLAQQNRLSSVGGGRSIVLEQGEMVQVDISNDVSVLVRYVADSPRPIAAPFLDLTASEFTGIVLSIAMVATLWLYTYLYSPLKTLGDDDNTEPQRVAMILLKPPTPPPALPPPPKATPAPTPEPTPAPTPPPKVVKVKPTETKEAPKEAVKKAQPKAPKADEGSAAANAAPNKNKTGPRTLTSPKQGGAIKTADKEGSQMQSKSKDVSKMGAFSAFAGGGAQDKLAGATTGSGELAGMAANSSGKAGSAVNRAGQGLGSELKDTGVGGTGKALEGVAGGIGTNGRGSGKSGYGTGGLGDRSGVKIVTGGTEEQIGVGIDKEAIRRVIMANLRLIRSCYEKQLNRKPDLMGKLILSWDIGEQGRVVATRVKSNELGDREVADCITEKLKTWRFPEPPANQVVVVEAYPFFFSN